LCFERVSAAPDFSYAELLINYDCWFSKELSTTH
jgi:hypothetical protein